MLNLDKWFNVEAGYLDVDNVNSLSNKIALGTVDKTTKSTIDINKINYSIYTTSITFSLYAHIYSKNFKKNSYFGFELA